VGEPLKRSVRWKRENMNRCQFWIRCLLVIATTVGMTFICSPHEHGLFETTWAKTPPVQDLQWDFHFQHDSARLDQDVRDKLDEVGLRMKQAPDMRAQITGYAKPDEQDPAGVVKISLGECRAQAVKDYLVRSQGIDPARVTTAGERSSTQEWGAVLTLIQQ
jgi:outer membrane protein OmpA-like peptidoglycan-associated protein